MEGSIGHFLSTISKCWARIDGGANEGISLPPFHAYFMNNGGRQKLSKEPDGNSEERVVKDNGAPGVLPV